jgi:hypothetical protein
MRYVPDFGIIPLCLLIDIVFIIVLMIKRTSRYVAAEYRPRHLSWVVFFSVPSYEYYCNRPLPLLHTFFPTYSSLLFYNLTIFGLHYIQNCKSQIRQNIRSSLFCDVSRRRVVASDRRFVTTYRPHLEGSISSRHVSLHLSASVDWHVLPQHVTVDLLTEWKRQRLTPRNTVSSTKSEAYHVHNRLKTDPDTSPLIHIRLLHLIY